ncbi:MAG: hypothetical protein ACLFPA_09965 [Dichotomicrobium sp.]
MRGFHIGVVFVLALVGQGCGTSSERMPLQEASEAQRLVFGTPQAVRTQFASQIGTCWFSGTGPLRENYSFTMPDSGDDSEPLLIRIHRTAPERAEVFQVQFYPHNDNTVVATRDVDMPDDLAGALETSVELWLLDPAQCRFSDQPVASRETGSTALRRADAGEDELQLPPLDEPQSDDDEEVDMHRAELEARGALD